MAGLRIGVDVGGTFTDVIVEAADGRLVDSFKLSSTPDDPATAVVEVLARVRAGHPDGGRGFDVRHGTTVGTNCLIEKRGARTALVATRGFRDVIALRRQARPLLFALEQRISPPLVPPELRFEIDERIAADGSVLQPIDAGALGTLVDELRAARVDAVAVALLNSHANPVHERRVAEAIRQALPDIGFVSVSSDIAPESGEFERTSTAVVNSYIGPRVADYVARLAREVAAAGGASLAVTKSNGGLTSPVNAARHPVHLIESGPAAGVVAVAALGRVLGLPDLIAFDMGGTTAKVGVVRAGEPRLTRDFQADRWVDGRDVGGYPLRSPVLDLVEIGAGGGSIAWLDPAGVVRIGPRSAGAAPGPACYGRGGSQPTVTDAHVAVGNIPPELLARSGVRIERALAEAALARHIADPLGWSVARAAHAVIDLATASMAELVRLATVRRGLDPRDFALVAYGGGGPLHAARIAAEVGVATVLVPECPGMFSASGTLRAEVRHDLARSVLRPLRAVSDEQVEAAFRELDERAAALLAGESGGMAAVRRERSMELRYEGQVFEIAVPVSPGRIDRPALEAAFRAAYQAEYGYELAASAVELVGVCTTLRRLPLAGPGPGASDMASADTRTHDFVDRDGGLCRGQLVERGAVPEGAWLEGPLLVADRGATVLLGAGQRVTRLPAGPLRIEVR